MLTVAATTSPLIPLTIVAVTGAVIWKAVDLKRKGEHKSRWLL
jgi:hypothetical protein